MSKQQNYEETKKRRYPHTLEFTLVLVMLSVLTALLLIMLILPIHVSSKAVGAAQTVKSPAANSDAQIAKYYADIAKSNEEMSKNIAASNEKVLDYCKWVITALLAAFGAWIGAGAAYFFGKANLVESSRSTEEALKIQQKFIKPRGVKYIKDINLTAMNTNFLFDLEKTCKNVKDGLNANVGYWFVPVIDDKNGALQDIIHAQIFWKKECNDEDNLKVIIDSIDKKENGKNLHGEKFYVKINLNDSIEDVYKMMKANSINVAIVVDEKNRPTHCLTRTDLSTLLQMTAND